MQNETALTPTDEIIPVATHLERYGYIRISVQEYMKLSAASRCYTVGSGKNTISYDIVHTTEGFAHITTGKSGTMLIWLSDPFEIRTVVADASHNCYAELMIHGNVVRIAFDSLLPDKICATLFSKGIAISKTDLAHEALSMHLQWLLAKFDAKDARQILGWAYRENVLEWNGYDTQTPFLQYQIAEASEEAYLKTFNDLIADKVELQFVICAAAASTLLAYLNMTEKLPVSSFGISLVGSSSTGKTTALQLAASLYSSIEDETVLSPFYGTQNALMHILGRHYGVPLCYDESTIRNDLSKSSFVYVFTEGKEKLRMNQDSTLKERASWLCTGLFSSEDYLVDLTRSDNLGLGARIITLDGYTYTKSSSHAEKIKVFAGKNYGIIGKMFSAFLLHADSSQVAEEFGKIRRIIQNFFKPEQCQLTDRVAQNYALILHTATLLQKIGVDVNADGLAGMCVELHARLSATANPGKNLVIKIFNYICCEYKHLKGIKWTTNKEGVPLKVEIIESTFAFIVAKCGVQSPEIAVKYLISDGFIVRPEKNRRKTKISVDGVPCYGYRFDLDKVQAAFGVIDDAVYSNVRKYKTTDPFSDEVLDIENDEEAVIHAGNYKIDHRTTSVTGKAFLL